MHSANHWGGSFEIATDGAADDEHGRNLAPQEGGKKDKYVDGGCIIVKRKILHASL